MEVVSCTQEVSEHAASLLANLNLLRCRALFCDCVVREGGTSAHLYPAHRCVLAASSPVFAALLPSSGALLELHDPRLPATVLAHVLDYIYTGVVPSLGGEQLFYSLLSAAEYLQMDGLLEALRAGPTDDGGFHTRAGYRFYSDKFGETPVKPPHKSSDRYTANTEDYEEPHHGRHATNKRSCIKQMEVNTASIGGVHSHAKNDINPRSGHTPCAMNVISGQVIRAEEREQSWRSPEREGSPRYQIHSSREQKKNLRTRVNTRKHLCSPLTTKRREELQGNKMEEDTNVGSSPARRTADVSTYSPAPPDPTPVPLHNKSPPPPLPHRSLSVSSSGSSGAVPVIHHSSEVLPQASLLVGYTRHASRTPCGHPGSTPEDEERTPRSNDTEDTDDGGPAADTKQDPLQDDGIYSLQSTFDFVKGSLSTSNQPEEGSRSFSDQPDKEKEHPRSHPLQEFDMETKPQIYSAPPVDKTSHHTYNNSEERSYLGHLRYHYLTSEPSHLMETHSDQADKTRPSSNLNQSPKGEQFCGTEPSAKLLFLDISSRSVQLQVFHQNRVGENGSGHGGYRAAGGESREGWGEAGPQALVEEPCTGIRVSPGVRLNPRIGESYAMEKRCDVDVCSDETRTRTGQETGGAACGVGPSARSKAEDRGYDPTMSLPTSAAALMPLTSLSLCTPSWLPAGRLRPELQQLYQCSLCERPFSQRGSLNRHVRSHLGVRPYLCPRCPMTFSRQYRVTEHMRVHERCVLRGDHLKVLRPPESGT